MKLNKTKIVATLGPSSREKPMLKRLLKAGVDVFRINFSHASYDETSQTCCCFSSIVSVSYTRGR